MLSNAVKQISSSSSSTATTTASPQSPISAPISPTSSQSSPSSPMNRSDRSGGGDEDRSGLIVESMSREETKNLIIQSLVNFTDDYFNNNSRCVILCALTCFIYDEILNQRWNTKRLTEAIKRIFRDLEFRDVTGIFQINIIIIPNGK